MSAKNFLFFGLGSIGQRHVRLLRELYGKNIKIYAVRSRGDNRYIGDDLKIDNKRDLLIELDIEEILLEEIATLKIDLAFICNPTSFHYEYSNFLADHGINIFCEKPLCSNNNLINELICKIKNQDLFTHVGYNLQFSEVCIAFKEIFNEVKRDLISISFDSSEFMPDWHKYEDYRSSYAARRALGGGVLKTLSHEFQIVCSLFDEIDIFSKFIGKVSNLDMDACDHADILMIGKLNSTKIPIRGHLDFYSRKKTRQVRLYTKNNIIELDINNNFILKYGGEMESKIPYDSDRNTSFKNQIIYIMECLEKKKSSFLSIDRLYEFHSKLEMLDSSEGFYNV